MTKPAKHGSSMVSPSDERGSFRLLLGRMLYRDLQSADVHLRYKAVERLQKATSIFAVPLLVSCLKNDTENQVRIRAAESLGNYKGRRVVSALIEVLGSDNYSLACAAAGSLGKVGGHTVGGALLDRLQTEIRKLDEINKTDVNWHSLHAKQFVEAFGNIGERRAVPILLPFLRIDHFSRRKVTLADIDTEISIVRCIPTLCFTSDSEAMTVLLEILGGNWNHKWQVIEEARNAVVSLGLPTAVGPLLKLLEKDSFFAPKIVNDIASILRRSADKVSKEDLNDVITLKIVLRKYITVHYDLDIEHEDPVDIAEIQRLALRELQRRNKEHS